MKVSTGRPIYRKKTVQIGKCRATQCISNVTVQEGACRVTLLVQDNRVHWWVQGELGPNKTTAQVLWVHDDDEKVTI